MQVRRHHRGEGSESAALCTKEGEQQQQQRRPSGEADAARRISTLVFDSARSSCLSLSFSVRISTLSNGDSCISQPWRKEKR